VANPTTSGLAFRNNPRKRSDAPEKRLEEEELEEAATTKDFLVVRLEGRRKIMRSLKY
jgi:hypothetical protein